MITDEVSSRRSIEILSQSHKKQSDHWNVVLDLTPDVSRLMMFDV